MTLSSACARGMRVPRLIAVALLAVVAGSLSLVPSASAAVGTSPLVVSGVIDGPLSGGTPKAIELLATADVDLSNYGLAIASNGNPSPGAATFQLAGAGSLQAGDYLYLTANATEFESFFGFAADLVSGSVSFNGDDAIELYRNGAVEDVFGVVGVDGTGEAWEYTDGWAKRTQPVSNTTFDPSDWEFSGKNALDNETSNDTAANPFPVGSGSDATPEVYINEVRISLAGSPDADFVEIVAAPNTDLSGLTYVVLSGEYAPGTADAVIDLEGQSDENGIFLLASPDAAAQYGVTPDQTVDIDFFGSPSTHMIVTEADATEGYDYDADNDGTLDSYPYGSVVDAVSFIDADAAPDFSYGGPNVGPSGNYAPAGAFRCDDAPTGTFDDNQLDFTTLDGTPGESNAAACDPVIDPEVTLISEVQGTGANVAITDPVIVQAIVVADYQQGDQLRGFFLQEEDADADGDPTTSEGIFVYCNSCSVDVEVGDKVSVTGTPSDFFGMSQINATTEGSIEVLSQGEDLPTPASIDLPAAESTEAAATFESVEGMLVTVNQTLYVSEYYQLARYGQLALSTKNRERQFTDTTEPDATGYADYLADLDARRIILDDDNNIQNSASSGAVDQPYFWPRPGLSTTNTLRGGDSIADLTGVLHWSFSGQSGTDAWRIRPVEPAFNYDFTSENPRPAAPDAVGSDFTVASFNVLNYFTTFDERGAHSSAELDRQRAKIADAICTLDADVIGLIEIENNAMTALNDLLNGTDGVNANCGTYAALQTGVIGTDEIAVAFIYKVTTTELVGDFAVLDSSVDPRFVDTKNRPALAQTFSETATGGEVTVVVNHLKSKGSSCESLGDPNLNDGAGNCNQTRTNAAAAMADWLAGDPTGTGVEEALVIGDLNSYRKETPIAALLAGADDLTGTADDFTDLLDEKVGEAAYSYLFDGQLGYLDYALASATLLPKVTGATVWHINADEVPVLDYNDDVRDPGEASFERESGALPSYAPDAFRASDHDPVLVGLDLSNGANGAGPDCSNARPTKRKLFPNNLKMRTVKIKGCVDPAGGEVSYQIDSVSSDEPTLLYGSDPAPDAKIRNNRAKGKVRLRAQHSRLGDGRVYTVHYTATAANGLSSQASHGIPGTVKVEVPKMRGASAGDDGELYDATTLVWAPPSLDWLWRAFLEQFGWWLD